MMKDMTPTTTETENNNMTCSICGTDTMIVRTGSTVQFQTERSYKCPDCGVEYTYNGEEDCIDEIKRESDKAKPTKNPIDHDKELGVVPDN
jgi:transposase-like protein